MGGLPDLTATTAALPSNAAGIEPFTAADAKKAQIRVKKRPPQHRERCDGGVARP
jgi:hypothetical protein